MTLLDLLIFVNGGVFAANLAMLAFIAFNIPPSRRATRVICGNVLVGAACWALAFLAARAR